MHGFPQAGRSVVDCRRMRRAPHFLFVAMFVAGSARAEYPDREVDRPIVLPPGMSEVSAAGEYARATRGFDSDARTGALPEGGLESAATATALARYGVFQGIEVWVRAPYVLRLGAKDERPLSGTGRAAFGARYEVSPRPLTYIAAAGGIVLPSTARALRTDPDGTLHRDHLAVSGSLAFKQVLLDQTAAWGFGEIVFPFANEDDDAAQRDPPATFRFAAGSLFQIDDRFHASAGASFTRTNRDRIAGGIVPRSDQFRVDLLPELGVQILPQVDFAIGAALPVSGKNTPQSYFVTGTARVRF